MNGFFSPTSELSSSEQVLGAYRDFIVARNGENFASREVRMREVFDATRAPVAAGIDGVRFNQNYVGPSKTKDLSPDELALLTFVKINAGEAWGVECVSRAREKQARAPGVASEVERLVTREEHFHTRLLVGAAGYFDVGGGERLAVTGAWTPSLPLRVIIGSLVHVPRVLFHPVLLAAEVAGVYAFNWLLGRVGTLFPNAPAIRESMEQRLIDVLIDEVGHIAFNRVLVGRGGRAVARTLAKQVVWAQRFTTPEMGALGFDSAALGRLNTFDLGDLPAEVRRQAFFA